MAAAAPPREDGPVNAVEEPEPARDRILGAAEELFADAGFDATPTSRIAERAGVPKGLVHYYFRRKSDLLQALVERLPAEEMGHERIVVPGDVAESLHRLVDELDRVHGSSATLSHLLWREADTHPAIRDALHARFDLLVAQIRAVIVAARPNRCGPGDLDSAAVLLASTVSYRHSVARHAEDGLTAMRRQLHFLADALAAGAGSPG